MFRLSICMMVKNESKNLDRCLVSLNHLRSKIDSELIIVDTGSSDNTVEIAKKYTEKVYFHEWNNNFAEMRNITISYASGEWLLIIDADEELIEDLSLISFLETNNKSYKGALLKLDNIVNFEGRVGSSLTTIRVFLNDGNFRYSGSVHNLPVLKGNILELDSKLLHYGYNVKDKDLMELKFNRTSQLLIKELEKNPVNIYYRYQLATTYEMYGDLVNARKNYDQAYFDIKRQNLKIDDYLYLWGPFAKQLIASKAYETAIVIAKEGLEILPDYLDLIYFCGIGYLGVSEWKEATDCLELYLEKLSIIDTLPIWRNPSIQFYSISAEVECHYNASQAYMVLENWDKAIYHSKWILDHESENTHFFNSGLNFFIKSALKANETSKVLNLYSKYGEERWSNLDEIVGSYLFEIDKSKSVEIYKQLAGLSSDLGIFIQDFIGNDFFDYNKRALSSCLQSGFEDAYYFAVLTSYDFSVEILSFSEKDLMSLLSRINEKYTDFIKYVEHYIVNIEDSKRFKSINLKRVLSKYVGLVNIQTESAMSMYFDIGVDYITNKYNAKFIEESNLKGFLNSEEQFLACLFLVSDSNISNSQHYIGLASEIFPEWTKQMLTWIDKKLDSKVEKQVIKKSLENKEMLELKGALISNIKSLIDAENYRDAIEIIQNYLELFELDFEIIELKNKIELRNIN